MKINLHLALMVTFLATSSLKPIEQKGSDSECYDPEYVQISKVKYKDETYALVFLRRDEKRIKAKYFAGPDEAGNSAAARYNHWRPSVENKIVLVLGGAGYMNNFRIAEVLTIDNGIPVNQNLVHCKMDALVIVHSDGSIKISNLEDGDLRLNDPSRAFNLRESSIHLDDFMEWAKNEKASVFQTHLLVYKNHLTKFSANTSASARDRRVLAVCRDGEGKILHVFIDCPIWASLSEGSHNMLGLLNEYYNLDVIAMINLDPGTLTLYNSDCSVNTTFQGNLRIDNAVILLTYYFQ
jgi:hypothetical protein